MPEHKVVKQNLRERIVKEEATGEEDEETAKRELLPILNPPSLLLDGFFD